MSTAPPTQMRGAGPRPDPSEQPRRRSLGRYLVMPITLGVVLLALYVYFAGRLLDSIEAGSLGMAGLSTASWQHVQLAAVPTVVTLLIAIPLRVVLTRPFTRRVRPFVLAVLTVL